MPPVALTVEFLADGRCVVTGSSEGVRAGAPDGPAHRAPLTPGDPAGGGFRCPIPYDLLAGSAVTLRVVAPSGAGRPDNTFPRLDWRPEGHDWVGTTTLPSAPAFVSLHPSGPAATGARFGWNFYGFFVFAAAFIGLYFAWARWMRGREQARAHA